MKKKDKVLKIASSNKRDTDIGFGLDDLSLDNSMEVSGIDFSEDLGGNPVTFIVRDEVTGEEKKFSGVGNLLVFFQASGEDNSWGQMIVGDIDKVSEVVSFLSKVSTESVKKIISDKKN